MLRRELVQRPEFMQLPDGRPVLGAGCLRRLQAILWLAAVLTYVGVLVTSLDAGSSDVWAVGKAVATGVAVAVLGRVGLALLARARHTPPVARAAGPPLDLSTPTEASASEQTQHGA